ncbi:hypothetical protein [Streptomyces shenzhenensis]|uniref:hypothetical protein n=1 Tax=Streptomyces shenzhenensis TaxID=943815 RepID=UPI0036AC1A37
MPCGPDPAQQAAAAPRPCQEPETRSVLARRGGLWASIGPLALSATGLTWSAHAGAGIGKIQEALCGSTPAAHDAGLVGVVVITSPAVVDSAYVVKENTRSRPERQDSVVIDPATGKVMQT